MSESSTSSNSPLKIFLSAAGVFVIFGFLALILSGYGGNESLEDRAYEGDFDKATIETRWANLEEISSAQAALVSAEKIDAALAEIAKAPAKPSKTDIVVPGSPTFLKQMEASAAADAEKAEEKPEGEAKPEESKEAPAEAAPEKKEETKPADEAKPAPEK